MEFQRFWVSGCHPPGWFHDNYFIKKYVFAACVSLNFLTGAKFTFQSRWHRWRFWVLRRYREWLCKQASHWMDWVLCLGKYTGDSKSNELGRFCFFGPPGFWWLGGLKKTRLAFVYDIFFIITSDIHSQIIPEFSQYRFFFGGGWKKKYIPNSSQRFPSFRGIS